MGKQKPADLPGGSNHWLSLMPLFLSVLIPTGAGAIDWRNDYSISLTQERDDNFRLTEVDPVATSSTGLLAVGELRGDMEVSNFQLGLLASATNYTESSIEDSELYEFFFETQRRGERWLGSLDMSYSLAPTTQTELLDTGTRIDGERESIRIVPGFSYQLDERNSVFLDLTFLDVSYDTVSLTEYTDNSISLGWVNKVSETSEISIYGSVSEYDPEFEDSTIDDSTTITGLGIGYGFDWSEATRHELKLGYAEAETPDGSSRDGNSSFEIRHIFDDRNSFTLFIGNGFVGSGAGQVRHESQLNLRWDHALADRVQFVLTAEGVRSDLRDYIEILAGSSYRYTREISIEANYRYRNQHTDTVDADSNSILFSLRYSPVSGFRHTL